MKRHVLILLFWLVGLFSSQLIWAGDSNLSLSTKNVSILVSDKMGPIVGANVVVKGTTFGGITDINGRVLLREIPLSSTIVISYIGYHSKELEYHGEEIIRITLEEDEQLLDEVVVVGYGTQKKVNLTGAVEQVTSEVFEGRPVANTAQMLMGAVPNLNINLSDGKPNRSSSLNIRGTTSIGQGGDALVLIDGVEASIDMLNPNDIESVSVLKDAAAASIYGARAPYGVVLITTKNPDKGKTKISYSANFTIQSPTTVPDIVTDGYTWAEHFYKSYNAYHHNTPSGINKTQQFSIAWLEEYKRRKESGDFGTVISDGSWGTTPGRYVYFNEGTDIYGTLYKNNVFSHVHNLSISGSEGKFDYFLSGRYYYYDGLFNSDTQTDKYSKFATRVKVGYQLYDWLKVKNNVEFGYDDYYNPMTYSEGPGNIWSNLQAEGFPSSPLFNPDGSMTYTAAYSLGDFLYGHSGQKTQNKTTRNTTSLEAYFFDKKLRINADVTFSEKINNQHVKKVRSEFSKTAGTMETLSGIQSSISESYRSSSYFSSNLYAEYENLFVKKHYFKAMLGYNYEQYRVKSLYGYNDDLLTENVDEINMAMGLENRSITSSWSKWRMLGYFSRLNYTFDDRYLLELNGRLDGSSKFPSNQRWAFFPSISMGWRVNKEKWFNVSPSIFSNLKVRMSYGTLGNGNVASYSYDELFNIRTSGRIFNGVTPKYTSIPSEIPESLTWETSKTFDLGLDLGLFNNKLNISADYYIRKTLDMYTQGPTLPDVFGATSPKGNYADMTTRGYEISLIWNDSFKLADKTFNYSIRATLADYQSTIDRFNNATQSIGELNYPGYYGNYYDGMKIGEIWGYVCNGLWQTQEEIDLAEARAKEAGQKFYMPGIPTSSDKKLRPGDIKLEDLNGNGYIDAGSNTVDNPGDRKVIGNTEPRYIYSLNLSGDWNNVFFSVFFQGVGKQDWYPFSESGAFWGQYNRPYNQMPKWHLNNYWTEENPDAYLPRYTGYYYPFYKGNFVANTRYLQNIAYIRLKNIQIGYNIPSKILKSVGLSSAKIYFSGENIWTWSPLYKHTKDIDVVNVHGSDSDLSDNNIGDGNNYPSMRSFSIGVNLSF